MPRRIHHFGLIVKNIEAHLADSLWELNGPIAAGPLQTARLCMVSLKGDSDPPLVELIEPTGPESPSYRFVARAPA